LQALLQEGRLKILRELDEAEILVRELLDFRYEAYALRGSTARQGDPFRNTALRQPGRLLSRSHGDGVRRGRGLPLPFSGAGDRQKQRAVAHCRHILCEAAFQGRHQIDHRGQCDKLSGVCHRNAPAAPICGRQPASRRLFNPSL